MTGVPWRKVLLIGGILRVLVIGGGAGGMALIFRSMRSCGAYQQAMLIAEKDPRVAQALGVPFTPDWYLLGSVNLVNDGGHADLLIPLRGKTHSGRLHVVADKTAGVWTLNTLDLVTMTGPDASVTLPLLP